MRVFNPLYRKAFHSGALCRVSPHSANSLQSFEWCVFILRKSWLSHKTHIVNKINVLRTKSTSVIGISTSTATHFQSIFIWMSDALSLCMLCIHAKWSTYLNCASHRRYSSIACHFRYSIFIPGWYVASEQKQWHIFLIVTTTRFILYKFDSWLRIIGDVLTTCFYSSPPPLPLP